jgi:hypothetical protein
LIVVCDKNDFITGGPANANPYGRFIRGKNALTINDALPIVSLATTAYDKRVFGVLSPDVYDLSPDVAPLTFSQRQRLVDCGDVRMQVNAMGDGCMWVSDINGPLFSGDLVTSSILPGYGQLQTGDLPEVFQNYTVAKMTCDCDFANMQQPVYVVQTDEFGQNILDPMTGKPTWIQDSITIMVDPDTGLPPPPPEPVQPNEDGTMPDTISQSNLVPQTMLLTESLYRMRWLAADGALITEQEYDDAKAAGTSSVYRAAFVGCTYHSA